jgi:hypothetical protein
MQVEMKEFEKLCREATAKWNKKDSWDFYCVAKDMYIQGFMAARAMLADQCFPQDRVKAAVVTKDFIQKIGEKAVQVDMPSNQIGQKE